MPARNTSLPYSLNGHVALVTGGNHGIGAATAHALAGCGTAVLVSYLRVFDAEDSGFPDAYRSNLTKSADEVVALIRPLGGQAVSLEADLSDASTPQRLFDLAASDLGPVDILINNATGWIADTFTNRGQHVGGFKTTPVSAATHDHQFSVDARGTALMIAEFARRHTDRRAAWGRIVGLTSGGPLGFPGEVSYGAAKAALENYTMSAAFELAPLGVTANIVHPPITDTGWITEQKRPTFSSGRTCSASPNPTRSLQSSHSCVRTRPDLLPQMSCTCDHGYGGHSGHLIRTKLTQSSSSRSLGKGVAPLRS